MCFTFPKCQEVPVLEGVSCCPGNPHLGPPERQLSSANLKERSVLPVDRRGRFAQFFQSVIGYFLYHHHFKRINLLWEGMISKLMEL